MRSSLRGYTVGVSFTLAIGGAALVAPAVQAQIETPGWAEVPDVPGLAKLDGGAALVADDAGTVVLVGFKGGKAQSALAWSSSDGTTWEPETLPGAKGSTAIAAAAGPSGFVAVGGGKSGGRIWHSPDGATWSDVGHGLAPKGAIYDVAATPDGYVAVGFVNKGKGNKARPIPTAWSSMDGMSWTASTLAKVPGAGLDVAAAPDGTLVATFFQPQRQGPKTGRTFQILPPSLELLISTDATTWRSAGGEPFVDNLAYLGAWDLTHAGNCFVFRADRLPNALSSTPDGFYSSADGTTWQPLSALVGIDGALGPLGSGAITVGPGPVLLSDDGSTWRSSYVEALAGARPRSLAALPDGRVVAVGDASGRKATGSRLYVGIPDIDEPVLSGECLDPTLSARIADAVFDPAGLPAPDREAIAAALAALDLSDADIASARDSVVSAMRRREAAPEILAARISAGEIRFPACA